MPSHRYPVYTSILWFVVCIATAASTPPPDPDWWAAKPVAHFEGTHSIDSFLSEKLAAAGLQFAPPADPRVLLRRVTYDLTGLPPTESEWNDFQAAVASHGMESAYQSLVDRLLESSAYGEKWSRHWLDLVRYADSLDARSGGKEGDILDSWRYRDWVVRSFQNDLPYNQFVRQQLAGDILSGKQYDADKIIATGMYAIGNWGNGDSDKQKVYSDIVEDQIDVTGRVFLGVTLACARCHDHKFDPISTRDYYAMAGVFYSSHILSKFAAPTQGESIMRIPLLSPEEQSVRQKAADRLATIKARLAATLEPLTPAKQEPAAVERLPAWTLAGKDNPSMTVNRTGEEATFSTVRLPKDSLCVHPGPTTAVSIVWKAPADSDIELSVSLDDADPNCGDGIEWLVRRDAEVLHTEAMPNGGSAAWKSGSVALKSGQIVTLVVRPNAEYTCDSTRLNLRVTENGTTHDFSSQMVAGGIPGAKSGWWVCAGEGIVLPGDEANPGLALEKQTLIKEQKALESKLAPPPQCHGFQEGGIPETKFAGLQDVAVQKRGRYDQPGEVVPRNAPEILRRRSQPEFREGSGRLELADWIADPGNPLTARVMVNRLWQHHFGKGIVATSNNFGKLGSGASHPELLDWLADQFIRSGWSIKAMHRLILRSRAYCQSSDSPDPAGLHSDPDNTLLWRQNRHKLTAEELRDSLLAFGNGLDRKIGGPSVRELGSQRRTLYLTTVRSERGTYPLLFDGADPTGIVESRTDSTVAPQALFLMNHPFVLQRAEALLKALPEDESNRLEALYRRLFQRSPTEEERRITAGILEQENGWTALCQILLCGNELMYID